MALDLGTLTVKIGADIAGLKKGMAAAKSSLDGLNGLGTAAAAGLLAWGASAYKAVQAAAEMQDTVSAAGVVFEGVGADINAWAKEVAGAVGRSESQMLGFAVSLQSVLDPLTGNRKAAAEMSTAMSKLAVDLASFYPGTKDVDALNALKSALSGETEPMKKFGVVINEAALAQQALASGLRKPVSALTAAEKSMLTYQLIIEKTKNAQGDATRTSDGMANQLKRVQASFDDLTIAAGQRLMPVAESLIKWVQDAIDWWGQLDPRLSKAAMSIGGIAVVGMGVVAAFSAIYTVMAPVVTAMGALVSGAMSLGSALAIPMLIIGGLLALLGTLKKYFGIGLKEIWAMLKAYVEYHLRMVKTVAQAIADGLSAAWEFVSDTVTSVWTGIIDTVKGAVLTLLDLIERIPDSLGKVIPGLAAAKDIAKGIKESFEGGKDGGWQKPQKKTFSGKDFEQGFFSQVKDFFVSGDFEVIGPLKDAIAAGAGDVLGSLKDLAGSFGVTDMESLFKKLGIDGVKDWKDIVGKLGDGAAGMLDKLMGALGLEMGGLGRITKKTKDDLGRLDKTAGEVAKALGQTGVSVSRLLEGLKGAGLGVAQAAAAQIDGIGGVLGGAIDKLAKGEEVDWFKTAIGAIVGVFANSTAFQEIVRYLNEFMLTLSEALGDLIAGILPVIKVVLDVVASILPLIDVIANLLNPVFRFLTNIVRGVGGVLQVLIQALMPFLTFVGQFLVPIFEGLTAVFMPLLELVAMLVGTILKPLGAVLALFGVALQYLGEGIGWVFGILGKIIKFVVDGIIGVYNWIVDKIADFASIFDDDWAASIRSAKISSNTFSDAMDAATTATFDSVMATYEAAKADRAAADAANKATEAMTNVPSGYRVALARYKSMAEESAPAKDAGQSSRKAKKHAKGGIVTRPTFALLGESGAEAVVPLSGSSNGTGLDSLGGGEPSIVIQQLTVVANNPAELLRQLKRLASKSSMALTGSPVPGAPAFIGG